MRVLVVEDQRSEREPLVEILRDEGYTVVEADSAASALSEFRGQRFDIVLLDYQLPDESGDHVLERLRGIDPSCPVLLVTGAADLEITGEGISFQSLERRAEQCGAAGYVGKPVDVDALLESIRHHTRKTA